MKKAALILMILSSLACSEVGTDIVVVANTIDGGNSQGVLAGLKMHGHNVSLINPASFEDVRGHHTLLLLGGHNAAEGMGPISSKLLDDEASERIERIYGRVFLQKEDVWSENQTVFLAAGYSAEDTRSAAADNLEIIDKMVTDDLLKDIVLKNPLRLSLTKMRTIRKVSTPFDVTNRGLKKVYGLSMASKLSDGSAMKTTPQQAVAAPGETVRFHTDLLMKYVFEGMNLSLDLSGKHYVVPLNITVSTVGICNICAGGL